MTKKRVYSVRSNQTTTVNGVVLPKLPTTNDIDVGELAINYKDGYETLSIRNDNNEIITFATLELLLAYIENKVELSDDYQTSSLTGDNLALLAGDGLDEFAGKLEKLIEENELVISEALNDLNLRLQNLSLGEDYEKSTLPDTLLGLNPGDTYDEAFGKIEAQIEGDGLVIASALNDLNSRIVSVENNPPKLSENYQTSTLTNTNLRLQPGENLDTFAGKLEKAILDDETITAAALNDLNRRKANTEDVQLMIEDYGLSNLADVATSGSYLDLINTPNTTVTQITNTGTLIATVGGVTLYAPDATVTLIVTSGTEIAQVGNTSIYSPDNSIYEINHGTSDTTFTLTPGKLHIWGEVSSLNLSIPADSNSVLDEYLFTFTCPSGTPTTVTLPNDVKWIQEPGFEPGKTYLVSIINGLAGYVTDDMSNGVVIDSTLNSYSTNPVENNVITEALEEKANKIPEVNHGTLDTTFILTPNIMHIWGEVASLNLELQSDTNNVLDEYMFTFTCPTSAATTLTLPNTVKWIQTPQLEAGKTYQVSIINNLAGYLTEGMEISLGDPNIIEVVKVNGTALNPDSNKAVDITAVTSVTVNGDNYTPDANGLVNLGTISGGGGSGGEYNVIEGVSFNGTTATITNKIAAITYTTPTLSKGTTTGNGNAVTDITVNDHTITLTKGTTFLTSYTETDPTVPAAVKAITSTDISNWNAKAADSSVVHLTGTETITGDKRFNSTIYIGTAPNNNEYDDSYIAYDSVNHGITISGGNTSIEQDTQVHGDLSVTGEIYAANGITADTSADRAVNKFFATDGTIQTMSSGSTVTFRVW